MWQTFILILFILFFIFLVLYIFLENVSLSFLDIFNWGWFSEEKKLEQEKDFLVNSVEIKSIVEINSKIFIRNLKKAYLEFFDRAVLYHSELGELVKKKEDALMQSFLSFFPQGPLNDSWVLYNIVVHSCDLGKKNAKILCMLKILNKKSKETIHFYVDFVYYFKNRISKKEKNNNIPVTQNPAIIHDVKLMIDIIDIKTDPIPAVIDLITDPESENAIEELNQQEETESTPPTEKEKIHLIDAKNDEKQ